MISMLDEPAVLRRDVGVVRVSGHDRLSYLHSLLSQHLADASAGTVADFLHLDHVANPLAAGRAIVRAGDVLLVVPRDVAAGLAETLAGRTFLLEVRVEQLDGWAQALVRGPAGWSADLPGLRSEPMTGAPHGDGMVVRDRSGGADLVGPAEWVEERVGGLGLPKATEHDWLSWRVANGVPEWGPEISSGRRPQELGLLSTHVHLRKGCYPGQETIAKTWNLGRPRRALVVLEADAAVAPGDAVDAGGRRSGEITSAAANRALALVPVDRDGSVPDHVRVGDTPGRVVAAVGAGTTPPGA